MPITVRGLTVEDLVNNLTMPVLVPSNAISTPCAAGAA